MLGKPAFTNRIVAKNLGLDEAKVNRVTSFFYKELDKEIKSCKNPYIFVKGLGNFAMAPKPIEKMIRHFLARIRSRKEGTKGAVTGLTQKRMRENIFELFRLRRMIKARMAENKKLKEDGRKIRKALHDSKGKPLSNVGD